MSGDGLLLSHADLKHLLGFLPSWGATEGGQAQRHATRILDLAHAVLLGHAEERCDRIGADRQADMVETTRCSGLELLVERARTLAAHRPRRDRVDQRLALGQGVVREAVGCEPLLAGQQRDGSASKLPDQRCTRG